MISSLVIYQLVLIALVWVFLMLYWLWPSEPAAARPMPSTLMTPPRKGRDPKPFPGLTHKPRCTACEHAAQISAVPSPLAPPPRITPTRGRRRQVDTSQHFCPHAHCAYRGWVGL